MYQNTLMSLRIWQEGSQFGFDTKSCSCPLTVWTTKNCWKIAKEMGIPDDLTCLLQNLNVGQEAIVRTRHGTMDWFKIGKGVQEGCILSSCLFNLYTKYINVKCQAGWIASWNRDCWEKYQQPQIHRWYHYNGRKWTKEPFDEGKRREWKSWLKIQFSKN